jgi:PAS domain S-box-containing protein
MFYQEAKNTAVTRLNEEQMIHARQAARGIEDFFATWTGSLDSLSKMDEIIDSDAVGKRYMKLFYEANQEQIRSITRLDERGVILYNFPSSNLVGTDISDQKHVRELLRDHKPVISDVFKAVEGFDAVALHVPVFRGSVFKGSMAILINFESLAKRYFEVIKIGETGYAWVVSRDGTQLYSPMAESTGKSVFETVKDFPSRKVMVDDMLQGHEGAAIYTYDKIRGRNVGQTRKYAVYMPVHIGNTFWSIAVASAEQDVLAGLISFRNKLAVVIGAIFLCGMVFSTLGAKAWLIVKEEERRKLTEAALRESEERFRALFQSATDGIILLSVTGELIAVNESFARTHGYSVEEMRRISLKDLDTPESFQPFPERIRRLLAGEALTFDVEHYHKDGHIVPLEVSASRIGSGGETFIQCFHRDITERKQAELEIARQRNELTHLSCVNMLGELAGSLAHELNQPLTAILSNAQAAQRFLAHDQPDLNEVRDILVDIVAEDKRAGEVIRRLRPLLKKGEVQRLPLNVNEVVLEALELVRGDLVNHGVAAQTELAPDLPVLHGDRVQLQQVLLNLVMNACDAMAGAARDDRQITIRTDLAGDGLVRVSVVDSGPGIAPDKLEQVFEPFYTTKPHGMGLGLAVCRTIIMAHGGKLWAANNPGRGASFHFALPAMKEEQT